MRKALTAEQTRTYVALCAFFQSFPVVHHPLEEAYLVCVAERGEDKMWATRYPKNYLWQGDNKKKL
jgi:hypothetical protein